MHILEDDLPALSDDQKAFIRGKLAEDWSYFDRLIEHRANAPEF